MWLFNRCHGYINTHYTAPAVCCIDFFLLKVEVKATTVLRTGPEKAATYSTDYYTHCVKRRLIS